MTYATDVCCTSITGGTGNLALQSITIGPYSGSPQFSDVWGNSAPYPWIDYKIIEYTDYTCTQEIQWEEGICQLVAGTTLGRAVTNSVIYETYVYGSGITPSNINPNAAQPIFFGSNPDNIKIFSGFSPASTYQTARFLNTTIEDANNISDLVGRTVVI